MKKGGFIPIIALVWMPFLSVYAQVGLPGTSDSPETLHWVQRQSERIDSLLADAMRGSEPIEILIRVADCYQIFDAVSMAGVYCTDVRAAAEAGRWQCDVINYRLEKDLNAKLQRAVEARRYAVKMREGAKACLTQISPSASSSFRPMDLLRQDAHMAELDLLDGMATNDLHILSQKLEHCIRALHDVEHLARTLENCDYPLTLAQNAVTDCQSALSAPNWTEVLIHVKNALGNVQKIQQVTNCN